MNRAEALALVIAPMPAGMARKIVRETLLSWPEADVADWHRMKDAERKREKRADVRSGQNAGTGHCPLGTEGGNRTLSGSVSNAGPDIGCFTPEQQETGAPSPSPRFPPVPLLPHTHTRRKTPYSPPKTGIAASGSGGG